MHVAAISLVHLRVLVGSYFPRVLLFRIIKFAALIGVRIAPGPILLILIPFGAYSIATVSVNNLPRLLKQRNEQTLAMGSVHEQKTY